MMTMKAAYVTDSGGPEVLKYGDLPEPESTDGVKIKVRRCGVNRLDSIIREHGDSFGGPHIPGSDIAGEVVSASGSRWQQGDRVLVNPAIPCGTCRRCLKGLDCEHVTILGYGTSGGYAEFVNVPERQVRQIPAGVSDETAAAFPLTYLTAWHMLSTRANLRPGEFVFVWGARGGLGTAAIQLANVLRGRVIAAVGADSDVERIRSLGAEFVVNYKDANVADFVSEVTGGSGVDVVFESVGEKTWPITMEILAAFGRVVIVGTTSGANASFDLSDLYYDHQSILGCRMGYPREFDEVLALLTSGAVNPVIDNVFPLSDVVAAHQRLEAGEHFGHIVLDPAA